MVFYKRLRIMNQISAGAGIIGQIERKKRNKWEEE